MLTSQIAKLQRDITATVTWALKEDLGAFDSEDACADQDITAMLIPEHEQAVATVITREDCIICGVAWVNEVFKQLDASLNSTGERATKISSTKITWFVNDGQMVKANTTLFELEGRA